MGLCLIQRVEALEAQHSAIDNPWLTSNAFGHEGRISEAISRMSSLSNRERMAEVEAALLKKWKYAPNWRAYLDNSLIAHADTILALNQMYDGVVGIESAGIPYAEIFRIMGNEMFSIDYSCHKRKMSSPLIDPASLEKLKTKKNVILADIDIITGETIRKVSDYLISGGVPVRGAYIGLSRWPGMNCDASAVNEDTIDFDGLWKTCGNTRQLKTNELYEMNIIPRGFRLFTSNGAVDLDDKKGLAAARRVAAYLKYHETENNQ